MRYSTRITLGLCFLTFGAMLHPAFAAQNNEPPTAPMSDQQVGLRMDFLDQRFAAQQTDAAYWEYGWGAFNGGSMIFSAVQASQTNSRKDRDMNIVQAVEGLIGVADVALRRLPAFDASSVCPAPVVTREDRMQCLAAKEALARRGADRANDFYEIMPHVENLGFNLLAGGIVWGLGGFNRGFITAVPGVLVGELQLWTIPGQPAQDYHDYQVHFSPMIQQTNQSKTPTVGLVATWQF